jgi:hypothetical protein
MSPEFSMIKWQLGCILGGYIPLARAATWEIVPWLKTAPWQVFFRADNLKFRA